MPFTILHISDLHRAPTDPISNDELLSTLVADRDRFLNETPALRDPEAIVVSGDLVQGARLGDPDFEAVLASQYETAREFVARLADEFVDGDPSRVVLVPGNHDVDWNTAVAAMEPVDSRDLPKGFSPALCGPLSEWRWRWDELRAYRIVDRDRYERRLEHFDRLVADFYARPNGVSQHDLFRIHTWWGGRIGVVAFNSCVGNDCFAFHGAIREEAVAQAHLAVRGMIHDVLVAVWHHSIDGDPQATDYMPVSTVQRMIGRGFRIGMHGHQHRGAAALRYIHLPEEERLAVISAGSLCAGRRELPPGVNRQYNVIELADDLRSARVHVREMAIATNFARARRAEFGDKSYVDLDWQLPSSSEDALRARIQSQTLEAEASFKGGNYQSAIDLLVDLPPPRPPFARSLLLGAFRESQDWDGLIREFDPPTTIEELVAIVTALGRLGEVERARAVLDLYQETLELPNSVADDLRSAIAAMEATA